MGENLPKIRKTYLKNYEILIKIVERRQNLFKIMKKNWKLWKDGINFTKVCKNSFEIRKKLLKMDIKWIKLIKNHENMLKNK